MDMLLELRNLSFAYGAPPHGQLVLDGLDLGVRERDFVIIRGLSGSGKSTILRLICRLQSPLSGTILFRKQPLDSTPPAQLRSSICYVPQVPVMIDGSVGENLLLPFTFRSNHARQKPSSGELDLMLERFYLSGITREQSAQKLSVGQKQRLALMRALLASPELLLLDEPTSALDRESAAMVFSIIERLNIEEGRSVIMVTHSDYQPSGGNAKRYLLEHCKLAPT
jgi:putative ABC transport system ATP-binding protein